MLHLEDFTPLPCRQTALSNSKLKPLHQSMLSSAMAVGIKKTQNIRIENTLTLCVYVRGCGHVSKKAKAYSVK